MIIYKIGKINFKSKNYVVFESNSSGYKIYCANIDRFEENKVYKLYIYEHKNEYSQTMYGFFEFKEKMLFEDLISLSGIGPKTALDMISKGWKELASLIIEGKTDALSNFRYVGTRTARQIIFEFQNKWSKLLNGDEIVDTNKTVNMQQVVDTLKVLGFKSNDITHVLKQIKSTTNIEEMIEEAIQLLTQKEMLHAPN